ncbi:fructosyl amine:oxygen oxidoreductase [Cryomyces antarcticus]|nr:hypothetical protein LTR60_001630 [Cryomyces antarcticus]
MSSPRSDPSILIIGGGTWGISTALALSRRGFSRITVLDAHPVPSPISAGNDVNKIMEEGAPSPENTDEEYVWNRLHQIASKAWHEDPVFAPYYHETGIVYAACSPEVWEHVKGWTVGREGQFDLLERKEDFRRTMPEGVLTGDFPSWQGFWKKSGAGWLFARGALMSAYKEAVRLGVKFTAGLPHGEVEALLYRNSTDSQPDVTGARTADGFEHMADWIILSAGANADVFFDFENQLRPTAWTLAHMPLTVEEYTLYKDLPVLFNAERGFFIEPDAEKHELKLCDEHPGYLNMVREHEGEEERSRPFARHQIPEDSERRIRTLLQDTMPHLAERAFSFARICWDADTVDRQFLIDRHPRYKSLIVAAGGSGMGFMMMPAVGKVVADTLEGVLEPRLREGFRWRPEQAVHRDWQNTQDRYGADGKVMDFRDVKEWTHVG